MEVALDDYIKTKNISRNASRGRRGAKTGQRGGRLGGGRPGLRTARFSRGGVVKKGTGRSPLTSARTVSRAALASGERWQHDLFGAGGGRTLRSGSGGAAKLLISNLDYGVSDNDINDLFAEFGTLKKAAVHYDRSARSIGTAEVIFLRTSDAVAAMRKYNGVPLDGRPMEIQLVSGGGPSPVASGPRFSSGRGRIGAAGRLRGARTGGMRGGRGRPGGRGGAQRRAAKPEVTQEQLDMELDEYQAATSTA